MRLKAFHSAGVPAAALSNREVALEYRTFRLKAVMQVPIKGRQAAASLGSKTGGG